MDDKLLSQLRLLKHYMDILNKIKPETKDKFLKDEILQGAAERYIQLSIETCINIGNRILSLEQFNHNIKPPETYADIFESLSLINIIDKNFAEQLKNMARFRNRLVHIYWEIDHGFVYELLQTKLGDITKFMSIVSDYISK